MPEALEDIYGETGADELQRVCRGGIAFEPVGERYVQAVWYDPQFRPAKLRTQRGELVEVLDPGEWNLEAGPDFLRAVVEIGGRRLSGDVEIHVRPSGWTSHRHSSDSAYSNVILHVTWCDGARPRDLPESVECIALAKYFASDKSFSPLSIDVSAYPLANIPDTPRPCEAYFGGDVKAALEVVALGGKHRISLKAAAFKKQLALKKREQLFYEEVMAALGYKKNASVFREVAQTLPVDELPREIFSAEACLLGTAGLLPEVAAPDSRERKLWDIWFVRSREKMPGPSKWKFANVRPANSPQKRLAEAAKLFAGSSTILQDIDEAGLDDPFKTAKCFSKRAKGLGAKRIAAVISNVAIPMALAEGRLERIPDKIPPEDLSRPVKLVANRLFGRDHNSALYSGNNLYIQGLLQIYKDFCLSGGDACFSCALAGRSEVCSKSQ